MAAANRIRFFLQVTDSLEIIINYNEIIKRKFWQTNILLCLMQNKLLFLTKYAKPINFNFIINLLLLLVLILELEDDLTF